MLINFFEKQSLFASPPYTYPCMFVFWLLEPPALFLNLIFFFVMQNYQQPYTITHLKHLPLLLNETFRFLQLLDCNSFDQWSQSSLLLIMLKHQFLLPRVRPHTLRVLRLLQLHHISYHYFPMQKSEKTLSSNSLLACPPKISSIIWWARLSSSATISSP